ncbi:MAG: molybdopterin-guanine dinucleotide biosynthesis protein B [Clostridium tyrobutyricum]|mgnify:CR=1 FL=1|jgi:molybdopterin-guanine dinucleotide biosynthesis protein B|uniref:molybdopterin-guanine dinucleotide biosynthesis protein B n=1 Tax=Clostridium tyrobutyricum TaxID=1519 RepID=UPI00057E9491|nr:molybdopterin-guanine dinucleotide biosynthesis protein B [Clostridium tyrobutyricum]MBV4422143.1 molybdopterin-guanine dinucleotide biosynthesis protein B [Clostridium tyrobutyricum]MCH4198522.1 molybdopterin-guanine dinucleotide biosynthesis protein B [Clostridium tyrobutyricum]MCH4237418.1 molybdopterin-guanine dinucleotide biosynthesis protein B [Clostridium tyrobutyricum]MCH4259009.1 molybdopterin-guanine dinucleotide biosynthesis protein B [Clostridium tyrobutyricum]MCI1239861.1 molyb
MENSYLGNLNTKRKPAVISIIAAGSNSGKTTLIEKLVKILKDRNYRVGVLKHGTHEFEIDKEGKDTYRFTRAGADNVIISNSSKMAIMKVLPQELDIEEVLRLFNDIDIVFIEGFRENKYPKIEVHRSKINDELLYQNSKRVDHEKYIGIASDEPLDMPIPVFNLNDACSIADFIENGYI